MTVRILIGHVLDRLAELPAESVHCCVTSPPYYGRRDYGIEPVVWGGEGCEHEWGEDIVAGEGYSSGNRTRWQHVGGREEMPTNGFQKQTKQGAFCRRCNAWRGSLGLEPTPALFIEHMIEVFRELRRVLRKDGTLFLNIGDSYASGSNGRAYDISGKEQLGFRQNDLISIRLCGGCRADLLAGRILRNDRSLSDEPSLLPFVSNQEHTESGRAHPATSGFPGLADRNSTAISDLRLDAFPEAVPPPVALASTTLQSSALLRESCLMDENLDGVCQSCGGSLTDYEPLSVGRTACISGIGKPSGASAHRTSDRSSLDSAYRSYTTTPPKPKDLLGIPWMLAFALRDDGWYLRSEITWAKKAPMPEGVTDRPTSATEKVFLLAKSKTYFYDSVAVQEEASDTPGAASWRRIFDASKQRRQAALKASGFGAGNDGFRDPDATSRNMRNFWYLGPEPFAAAHFATFPSEIPRRAILAGCPKGGTVLDPFFGAGTTGLVADRLGRDCIGIDINPAYAAMAEERIRGDCPLFVDLAAE